MLLIRNTVQRLFSATNCGGCQPLNVQINSIQVRTKTRNYIPHPTETKRVRKQGLLKKLQTPQGRRELMLRILRGDKVIAQ